MIDKYEGAGNKKAYLIFSLTDETYSILCSDDIPEDVDPNWYRFFVSLFNQSYWILGCVLGSLVGTLFTFDTAGIDFSMTALFVTVFVEQWLTTKNHWPAIIGLCCSIICLVIFGANSFLIPTMIAITLVLPYSIMGMLVVYCLKDVSFVKYGDWLPGLISVVGVVLLHVWKRNTLLSIIGGTACYMLLIRFVI